MYVAPSGPPQSVAVYVVSSTSVSISWNPPPVIQQNGIIRTYSVILYDPVINHTVIYSSLSTSLNVSVLSPYTKYSVRVAAITVAIGPYSDYHNITTMEDGM